MAYLLNPKRRKRTTSRRRKTARRKRYTARRVAAPKRRRRTTRRRRKAMTVTLRANPRRVSYGPKARGTMSRSMKGAWRTIKRRHSSVRRGVRRYNPKLDIVKSLKTAGNIGLGYGAAMIIGSTVTENLFPRLPKIVRIVLRSLVGSGIGYGAKALGHNGEDIVVGSLLYGLSEIARDFLAGRKLPLVLKSGLEGVAAALPVPAGTVEGYVFEQRVGKYVPDQPLPLSSTARASRTRSRFARA